jgi:hypothetical protein
MATNVTIAETIVIQAHRTLFVRLFSGPTQAHMALKALWQGYLKIVATLTNRKASTCQSIALHVHEKINKRNTRGRQTKPPMRGGKDIE